MLFCKSPSRFSLAYSRDTLPTSISTRSAIVSLESFSDSSSPICLQLHLARARDYLDRKWLRLRSEVQKFYSVSETVTKVYRNGDAGLRFDGRHDAGHAVMFLDDARFLFHLRKGDRE